MFRPTSRLATVTTALQVMVGTTIAQAAEYGGGGLQSGLAEAGAVVGTQNLRSTIIEIVKRVLSYMALAAVVVIVIAGIMLVVSGGSDESRDRARRMILYAIIGLIVILIARGLVLIFTDGSFITTVTN